MKKTTSLTLLILLTITAGAFYAYSKGIFKTTKGVSSLSISADGHYVISAHYGGSLVLWDIQNKEKKILAKNANVYSAYFIPDSHEFIWQDDKNIVYIQNINGQIIKSFPHFKTEGHRITADKSFYLSANTSGKLYKGYGENMVPIYTDTPIGPSKPYDLSIVGDYFLSVSFTTSSAEDPPAETHFTIDPVNPSNYKKSSYEGVTLWDKNTLKPIAKLKGNNAKTTGLISPDGKWVITGSENYGRYMWSTTNPNLRISLAYAGEGFYNKKAKRFEKSQLLPVPDKFKDKAFASGNTTVAYAFVTETEFIQLGQSSGKNGYGDEITPLYTVGDPWIKAYVEIGNDPSISTNYYQRNLSVSSSPQAHILVTGQATGGGINVYRYHPDKMELEKIWVAD